MSTNSIKLLASDVHRGLAELVSRRLGLRLTPSEVKRDSTGEVQFLIGESVRDVSSSSARLALAWSTTA